MNSARKTSRPEPSPESARLSIIRYRDGRRERKRDDVAREEPLEIRVRGQSVAVTMRTPGHDAELACGFLFSEGLLTRRSDVVEISRCESGENAALGNILNVFLAPNCAFDFERLKRHTFASSSCGLCGKASIESVHQHFAPITTKLRINPDLISALPSELRERQETFSKTGGLHAAGIFNTEGQLLVLREDVGRHNAVDKVLGWAFLQNHLPLDKQILFVSGRSSFEIMQKALAARLPIVAAVSAPSSLAVEFARESNQTLIGFVRENSFNIYSGSQRVARPTSKANNGSVVC